MDKQREEKLNQRFALIQILVVILIITTGSMTAGCNIIFSKNQCSDRECIKNKIEEAENLLRQLQSRRSNELQSIYDRYSSEHQTYYEKLREELPRLGISNHEELLRQCDKYIVTCNLLERTAILQYSLNWLKTKIDKVDLQIGKLDQNIWRLNKKLELSAIASPEDQDKVNELIAYTKVILEEQIAPPEAEDPAKLQKEIFNNIVKSSPSPTASPEADPSPSPTDNPTASPEADPSPSPTDSPTTSPEADLIPSPTDSPTTSP
ncbi:hypothetical protein ACE1CD_30005 [Aerosakkonema sp. BLCC-F183]|uniref:hypothetical protein n=1 Tax=Aerosakkonema sp. BLCC-F183 TaxID=3342834 RepID=UPI0035B7296A